MHRAKDKVLSKGCGNDAHGRGVLTNYAKGIVIDLPGKQRIAGLCLELPLGNVQRCAYLGCGNLGKIILPLVVVGVKMLLVKVRFLKAGMETGR